MAAVAAGLDLAFALRQGGLELEVALAVAPGETVVLVGPSGSGKTTCLRAVAGLARPRAGRIAIAGRPVFDAARRLDLPPWRRRVAVVFQEYALFPHLTVAQNVRYGLGRRRDAARRVEGSGSKTLGIADLAARRPPELSGGQQQRVALARAAAMEADLLLLDEPFGSLDAATRRSVRGELRRYLQRAGRTTLLVSHDHLDALTFGDRIAVLEAGRLTQVGSQRGAAPPAHPLPRRPHRPQRAGRGRGAPGHRGARGDGRPAPLTGRRRRRGPRRARLRRLRPRFGDPAGLCRPFSARNQFPAVVRRSSRCPAASASTSTPASR